MDTECFHTGDMALVAYLATRAISFSRMEKVNGTRSVVWYFDRSDALEQELDEYRVGEAMVEPREFQRQMARVRTQMFEEFGLGRARV